MVFIHRHSIPTQFAKQWAAALAVPETVHKRCPLADRYVYRARGVVDDMESLGHSLEWEQLLCHHAHYVFLILCSLALYLEKLVKIVMDGPAGSQISLPLNHHASYLNLSVKKFWRPVLALKHGNYAFSRSTLPLAVTAPGRLQYRVQAGLLAVNCREINVYARFNKRR